MSHPPVVLVVEDHPVLANSLKDTIEDLGCLVCGPFRTMTAARAGSADAKLDFAIVDLGLPDGDGLDLVRELDARGIPCAIYSGYSPSEITDEHAPIVHWIDKTDVFEGTRRVLSAAGLLRPAP